MLDTEVLCPFPTSDYFCHYITNEAMFACLLYTVYITICGEMSCLPVWTLWVLFFGSHIMCCSHVQLMMFQRGKNKIWIFLLLLVNMVLYNINTFKDWNKNCFSTFADKRPFKVTLKFVKLQQWKTGLKQLKAIQMWRLGSWVNDVTTFGCSTVA